MNRVFKVSFFVVCLLLSANIYADNSKLTIDKDVRIGTLSNGLTYYIRHNAEPENRAFFYLAQKVGAIEEEPYQRGLAHFLEHMCFNGTQHFPGDGLRHYLESIGVKFGADLNAYTSIEETVYNIDNVPTGVAGAIDSCLLILRDWSDGLTLDGDEIDKERGVIQEEWRMRNSVNQRLSEKMMPVILAGSKYADSMPIGSMDVVMNFKHQALRDYYEKWYRPDLQAVVVVGDIDVDDIEQRIRRTFGSIAPAGKDASALVVPTVKDNQEPIVFIASDKEVRAPKIDFWFKHDVTKKEDKNTERFLIDLYLNSVVTDLFHARLSEIAQKANTPFGFANGEDGDFYVAKTKGAFHAYVSCHTANGDIEKGERALLRELFRARRFGFTESEFSRNKTAFLTSLDRQLRESGKRYSKGFVEQYVRHFIDGTPIPSLEDEIEVYKRIVPTLKADDLNQHFRSFFTADGSNMVICLQAPQNDSLRIPTDKELLSIYKEVENEPLSAYNDATSSLPFLPKEPVKGRIVKEQKDADGLIRLELSNGAKVVIMPTDFQKDAILLKAIARGGSSCYPKDLHKYFSCVNMSASVQGWGNWSVVDMTKQFAGKTAQAQPFIEQDVQGVQGSCTSKFAKEMFERVHACFLYPHKDESAFKATMDRYRNSLRNSKGQPTTVYQDSMRHVMYGDDPLAKSLTVNDLDEIDYDAILRMYRDRFSDASGFTFFIVGNADMTVLRPLIEKYVASLPSTHKNEKAIPLMPLQKGEHVCDFVYPDETPKTTITALYSGKCEYNLRNMLLSSILSQILTITYTKTIREDAGAAYSVGVGCDLVDYPSEEVRLTIQFPTAPESKDIALKLIEEGIRDIISNGASQESIDKTKEYMLKMYESNQQLNPYWLSVLTEKWQHGVDMQKDYVSTVRSITASDVQKFAKRLYDQRNKLLIVMSSK